jgi:putative membrane protein
LNRRGFDVWLTPMLTDLILAILHHLAIVTLIVLLAFEFALLRPGITPDNLRRVIHVDASYGAVAALVILIGVSRVIWGAKGAAFYISNPWFWAKMASFLLIGLLSIPPTLALLKWRRHAKEDASFRPGDGEIVRLRRFIHAEVALLALVVAFAAAMARYGAF